MRILTDTNVILDIFLDREPFVDDARLIWKAHEEERLTAYVSAITPVNLFYIARKLQGHEIATRAVHRLLATLPVTTVNQSVLESALMLGFEDFEDAVQHESAEAHGLDAIIIRNIEDFTQTKDSSKFSRGLFLFWDLQYRFSTVLQGSRSTTFGSGKWAAIRLVA